MSKKSKEKKVHYVDNKEFLAEMIKFKEVIAIAHEKETIADRGFPITLANALSRLQSIYRTNLISLTIHLEMR